MKKKTHKVVEFLEKLHDFIIKSYQLRKKTITKSEAEIQAELRPLIIRYLELYFEEEGYKDYIAKANKSFYWEGQEGQFGQKREPLFGARNYPDFIITDPYLIAIEYKQSPNGSTVKHGIGQSLMHTLCEDFDFVYYLFHDESLEKKIQQSGTNEQESKIIKLLWEGFNVFVRFI